MKYKLRKEYPGSPKLGTEATLYYNEGYKLSDNSYAQRLSKDAIEQYPEFWEEVKEIDYEILTVIAKWSSPTYCPGDIVNYNKLCDYDSIHSIKRLSDGEVFTVGDKLVLDKYMEGRKYITIDSIYYNEHKQLSFKTNIGPPPCTFVFGLLDINCKRYEQSLFVTEDGKEIYHGMTYYRLRITDFEVYTISPALPGGGKVPGYKYFSTKEAAEKWIDENKPKYSKKDILKGIEDSYADCCLGIIEVSNNIDLATYFLQTIRNNLLFKFQ